MKMTVAVLAAVWAVADLAAQDFKVLVTFEKGSVGNVPTGGLVPGNGYLYGTLQEGGNNGLGSVFRVGTNGTPFVEMLPFNGSNGKYPNGGLVLSGLNLYGTTTSGGTWNNGVVFKLWDFGSSFSYSAIKNFATNEGRYLNGGLALSGSMLYGSTRGNLVPIAVPGGDVVFKLQNDGSSFTVLSNLTGMNPLGGLLVGGGTLYGTTRIGGSGYGTVYRIGTSGTSYAIIKSFSGSDGSGPNGNLVLSGDTLYGMTASGGAFDGGTVFKINTNGSDFDTLKSFPALVANTNSDGATPAGGLLLSGYTLYGATVNGGSDGNGVIFKINTDGSDFAVLKHFPATWYSSGVYTNRDGANPNGDLVAYAGTLYGVTSSGGTAGKGVLFSLVVRPVILTNDGNLGVRSNCFGFCVTGISNQVLAVEACTNLATGNWTSIYIFTSGTGAHYFSDSRWTNYGSRYYRVRVR